jgi:hypothetical protein
LDATTNIGNKLISIGNHIWKIFERLDYHYIDASAVLRGTSLKKEDRLMTDIGIKNRKLRNKSVLKALMELYGKSLEK